MEWKEPKSGKKDVGESYVNLYSKPFGCERFYVNTQTWTLYRLSVITSIFLFYLCFITLNCINQATKYVSYIFKYIFNISLNSSKPYLIVTLTRVIYYSKSAKYKECTKYKE